MFVPMKWKDATRFSFMEGGAFTPLYGMCPTLNFATFCVTVVAIVHCYIKNVQVKLHHRPLLQLFLNESTTPQTLLTQIQAKK